MKKHKLIREVFPRLQTPTLIAVIHLPPLAGSPGQRGEHPTTLLERAGLTAIEEARALSRAGFDGIIIENFGDAPFFKHEVPPETVASLAIIVAAVREATPRAVEIGVNVLRNDARAALAIAAVTGCSFIRVNILSGVAATDQGLIEGDAAFLLRERERLGAEVAILGDVHVKHARSLSSGSMEVAIEEIGLRSLADAVIVIGETTGRPVEEDDLERASKAAKINRLKLFVGSGVTTENVALMRQRASGLIVGSVLRCEGRAGAPLDGLRIRKFIQAYRLASKASNKASKTSKKKR